MQKISCWPDSEADFCASCPFFFVAMTHEFYVNCASSQRKSELKLTGIITKHLD